MDKAWIRALAVAILAPLDTCKTSQRRLNQSTFGRPDKFYFVLPTKITEKMTNSFIFYFSLRPCSHLAFGWVLVDWIISTQWRHIPVYSWCFNPSFDHFLNFYEVTVYGQCMYGPFVIFRSNIVK